MSKLLRDRAVPLGIVAALAGGVAYSMAGGRSQPRPMATGSQAETTLGQTMQGIAGSGGPSARSTQDVRADSELGYDPKGDTKMFSASPSAHSKRNPEKTTGGAVTEGKGGGETPGALGKHIGDKSEGSTDLPWKGNQ